MIYCISDIHGELDKYKAMLELINLTDEDTLYVIGDVIDRKPHGVDILLDIMSRPNVKMIMGNHEKMMLESEFIFSEITDESIAELSGEKLSAYSDWMANGGAVTLEALRKESPETI